MRFSLRFTFSFPKISAPHAALPYDNTTLPERQEARGEKASFVRQIGIHRYLSANESINSCTSLKNLDKWKPSATA